MAFWNEFNNCCLQEQWVHEWVPSPPACASMRDAATAIPSGSPSSCAAPAVRPFPTASPGDRTWFPGQTQDKPNTCQFTKQKNKRVCYCKSSLPPPPVKPHIYKTKKSITELCVMEHLSLSGCRLNTTVPDQAIPWQFRSSKAFNILSSHRERLHHKQLNSAWHLSRRYEMQKSQVLVEGAACRHSVGMEGDSAQSVLTNEHCTCCTRNAQGTGQFFLSISILSSSSARNKVAIATETLKKKLA